MLKSVWFTCHATRRTANCVALAISDRTGTDTADANSEPQRYTAEHQDRVTYSTGWIASPATRDCLSWHWIARRYKKRGFCYRPVSVRPSVRESGTLVHCIQTAEDIVIRLCQPGIPIILVFSLPAPVPNSNTPSAGAQNTREWKFFLRFSTEIAVYLGNGKR